MRRWFSFWLITSAISRCSTRRWRWRSEGSPIQASNNSSNNSKRKETELMAKGFASTTDLSDKKVTFSEIGTDLYAFTAEGDPNSAVIVGQDGCIVFDAQATPAMANKVIERVRTVTDK